MVQSCIERLKKPDKAIFDLTLERLGVGATDVVFLDDLGGNLKAAREMGMATIKVGAEDFFVLMSCLALPFRFTSTFQCPFKKNATGTDG